MAIHPGIETSDERVDVAASVRPRVINLADEADVDRLIREALDELTPANVSTFLPILVERRVRDRIEHGSAAGA
jgi:hypothetical protein